MPDHTRPSPLSTTRYRPVGRALTASLLTGLILGLVSAGCASSTTEQAKSKPAGEPASKANGDETAQPDSPPARTATAILPAAAVKGDTAAGKNREVAILAGGCFWGMEEILRGIDGVIDTDVGYAGGNVINPKYKDVSSGATGHAESVRVVFDPTRLSYEKLLSKWFFRMHDPTTLNRQGNDIGTQYRSAIFYTSPEQQKVAEAVKKHVDASGQWKAPIVTQIVAAGPFTLAEDHHQDYLQRQPDGYTCHFVREELEFPISLPEGAE